MLAVRGQREALLVTVGTLAAFLGAYVATRYLDKVTIRSVRHSVAGLMFVIGLAMATGVVG